MEVWVKPERPAPESEKLVKDSSNHEESSGKVKRS